MTTLEAPNAKNDSGSSVEESADEQDSSDEERKAKEIAEQEGKGS